jgi:hypothetical protein
VLSDPDDLSRHVIRFQAAYVAAWITKFSARQARRRAAAAARRAEELRELSHSLRIQASQARGSRALRQF